MSWLIWIYRLLFLPTLIFLLPYYLLRMFRRGGYLRDFHQRIGFGKKLTAPSKPRIWIQAVSVGEILAIESLVRQLQEKEYEVVITTTTSTGYQLALEKYQENVSFTGLFPLDFLPFTYLTWQRIRPTLAILMESELWPEHLWQARQRKVPVLLVNARMSDHSFKRAKRVKWAYRSILQSLEGIAASSPQDLLRYTELGFTKKKAICSGNLKLDFELGQELTSEETKKWRQDMGFPQESAIILGSSTWPGEEDTLLEAFMKLLEKGLDCRLVLVPRHVERRHEIRQLLENQNLPWHFRTDIAPPPGPVKIYVADTTGELRNFTQLATVAFIGKTLPPNEGSQSPIEAAAFGIPSIYGPSTSNFRIISQQLESANASYRIKGHEDLFSCLFDLLNNGEQLRQMSEAARSWHMDNAGATKQTLNLFSKYLEP